MVNQPKYLSAESVATMSTEAFKAQMKNLDDDLTGYLPTEECEAITMRTTAVQKSLTTKVKAKAAKVLTTDAEWAAKKLRNPANSMAAKFRGIGLVA